MKRRLRTRISLLKRDFTRKVDKALFGQRAYHDRSNTAGCFQEGDQVWVLNTGGKG